MARWSTRVKDHPQCSSAVVVESWPCTTAPRYSSGPGSGPSPTGFGPAAAAGAACWPGSPPNLLTEDRRRICVAGRGRPGPGRRRHPHLGDELDPVESPIGRLTAASSGNVHRTLPSRQRTVRLDGIPGHNRPRLFDSTPSATGSGPSSVACPRSSGAARNGTATDGRTAVGGSTSTGPSLHWFGCRTACVTRWTSGLDDAWSRPCHRDQRLHASSSVPSFVATHAPFASPAHFAGPCRPTAGPKVPTWAPPGPPTRQGLTTATLRPGPRSGELGPAAQSSRPGTVGEVGPRRGSSLTTGSFPRDASRTRRACYQAPGSPQV